MRTHIITYSMLISFTLGGCANMTETQKGTATGAGIGAVAGAAIGAVAGGNKGVLIGAAVGAAAGGLAGNVWSKKMQDQKTQMEQATAGSGVTVSQTADNRLKLDIPSDISFDINRADIQPNLKPILDTFANGLSKNPATTVTVVGHTDSSGNDAINNPLSLSRAKSVRDYLVTKGVAFERFTVDGKGAHQPMVANDTATNRAKNRRVEIFVAEPQPPHQ